MLSGMLFNSAFGRRGGGLESFGFERFKGFGLGLSDAGVSPNPKHGLVLKNSSSVYVCLIQYVCVYVDSFK